MTMIKACRNRCPHKGRAIEMTVVEMKQIRKNHSCCTTHDLYAEALLTPVDHNRLLFHFGREDCRFKVESHLLTPRVSRANDLTVDNCSPVGCRKCKLARITNQSIRFQILQKVEFAVIAILH